MRLHLSYLHGGDGVDVNLPFSGQGSMDGSYSPSYVGACQSLRCSNAWRVYGGSIQYGVSESLVTTSCLRILGTMASPWTAGSRDEHRVLFSARY